MYLLILGSDGDTSMCNSPIPMVMPNKIEAVHVPCRRCRSCITDTINDHVARGLCEAHEREWSVVLTLTYRDQMDGSHETITKEHLQLAIKRLRKRLGTVAKKNGTTSTVRYVGCGEYGALKGRAHFHVILFGDGPKPEFTQGKRTWPVWFWDKGHVCVDWKVDAASVRYVMKYLYKWENREDDTFQKWVTRSNSEPLGWVHIQKKVQSYVDAYRFPTNWLYAVPGWKKKGRMSDATRRRFVCELIYQWCVVHGRPVPWDELSATVCNGIVKVLTNLRSVQMTKCVSAASQIEALEAILDQRRMTPFQANRAAIDALTICPPKSGENFYGAQAEAAAEFNARREKYEDGVPDAVYREGWESARVGGLEAVKFETLYQASGVDTQIAGNARWRHHKNRPNNGDRVKASSHVLASYKRADGTYTPSVYVERGGWGDYVAEAKRQDAK